MPCRRLPKGHKLFPLFSLHIRCSFSTDVFTLSCPSINSRKDTSCSLSSPYIFFTRFLLTSLPYRALSSTPEWTQAVPSLLLTYSLLVFSWRLYLIVPCRRLQKGHKLFPLFSLHILYSFSPDVFTLSCPVVDSRKDTSFSLSSPYIFFTRFLLTSLPYRALSSTPERTQAVPSLLLTYLLLVFYWRLYLIVPCRRLQKGHKLFPLFSLHIRCSFSSDVFTLSCPVVDSRKDTSCSLSSPYIFFTRFLLTSLPYRALSSTQERTQAVPSPLLTYSLFIFYWRLYFIVPCRRLQKGHELFPLLSLHIYYSFSTDVFTLSCPVVDSRKDTSCSLSSPYIFFIHFLLTSLPYRALSSTPERTQAVPSLPLTYSLLVFSWRLYLIVPCRRLQKGHKLFPLFSLHILYSFSTDVFNLSCPVVDSQKDTSCSLSSPFIFFSRFLLTSLPYRALSSTPERTQAVPSLLFTYSLFIFYWRLYLIVPCRRFPKGHKLFPLFSLHILYSFSTDVFTLSCPVVDSRKDTSCSLSSPYIFFTRFLLTSLPYRALSSTTERTQAFPLFSLHICCSFSTDVFTLSCPVVDSRKDISCSLSSSFIFFTRFLLTSLPYRALSSTPERTQAVPSLLLTYSLFIFYWRLYLILPCRRFPKGHKLFPLFSLHILYSFSTDVFTLSCPVVDSRKDTSCSLSSPYIFFTRFLLTSLPYRALSSTPERTQAVPSLLLTYSLIVFYWRLYLIVPCRQLPKGHKLLPHYSLHILYSFSTDVFTLSCPVVDSRKDTSCSLSSPYIFFTRFLLTSLPYRALSSTPERTQAVPSPLLTYSLFIFYWRLYFIVPCRRLQKGHELFPLFSLHIFYSFSTDVFTLSCPVVDSRKDTSCSLSSPYIYFINFLLTSLPYRALSSTPERTQAVPSLLLTYSLFIFYWRLYLIVPCRRLQKGHKLFPLFSLHIRCSFSTDIFTLSCPVVDSRKDTSCSLSSPYIFFTRFLLTSLPYRALSSTPERTQAVPSLLLTYSLFIFYWRLYLIVPCRRLPKGHKLFPLFSLHIRCSFSTDIYLIVPCRRLQKGHKLFPLFSLHILYLFSTDVFTLSCPVVDSRKDTSCSLSSPYIFVARFRLTSLPDRALPSTPERTQAVPSLLLTYSLLVLYWRLYLIVSFRQLPKGHKLFPLFSLHICCSFSTDVFTLSCPVVDSRKDTSCSLSSPYIFFTRFLLTSLPYRALSSTPERTQAVPSLLLTYLLLVFDWRLYLIVPFHRLQKGHKLFPLSCLRILYSFCTDVFTFSCPSVNSRKDISCSLSSPYIFVARFLLTSLPYRALPSTPERTQAVPSLLLTYSLLVFYWRLYLIVPCRRLQNGHKLFPLFSLHILYSFSPDVFTLSCPVVDSRKGTSCSLSSPYIFFTRFLLTSLPYRALSSTPERIQAFPSLLLTYFLLVFYWRLYLIVPCRRLQKGHKLFLSSPYIFFTRFLLTSLPYRALSSTPERTQAVPSLLLTYSLLVFFWRLYLIVPCRRLQKGHKLFPLFSLHILHSFSTDVFTLSCPVVDSRKDTSCSLSRPYIFFIHFLLTSILYRALSSTPERTRAVPSLVLTYLLLVFYWRLYLIVPCRRLQKGHKLFPLFSYIFFIHFLLTSLPYRALSSTPERTQAVPSLPLTYSLLVFYGRLYLIVPCRRLQKGHKLFPLFSLHILYSFSTDVFNLSCPVVDSQKDTSCSLSSPFIFFSRFLLTSLPYRALSSTPERTQAVPSLLFTYSLFIFYWRLYLIVPCRRFPKGHKLFPLFSLHILYSFSTDVFTLSCPVVDSRKDTSCSLSSPYIFFTRFLLTSLPYRALSSTTERTQAFPLFSLHICCSFSTDVFTLSCPVVDSRKDISCSLSSSFIFFTRFLLTSLPYRALSSTPERTQAVPSLLLTYSLFIFYWRLYLILPCRRFPKGHKLFPLFSLHILYSFSTDVFTLSCPVVDSRKDTSCSLSSPYIFFTRFLLTSLPYRALSSTPERTQAVPSLLLTYSLLVFYWRLYLIVPCRQLPKGHKLLPHYSLHILYSFSTDVFTLSCPVVDSRKDTSCSLSSPYIFVARFLLTSLPYRALSSTPERTQAVPSLLLTYSLLVFFWRLYLIVPCRRLPKGHKLFPLFSLHILYSFSTDVFTLSCPVVDSRKDTRCSLSSPYIFFTRFLLTSLPYRALSSTPERTQAVPSLLLTYSLLVFYWRLYLIVPCRRLQKGHKLFPLFSLHIRCSFSTDTFTLSCPVVDSRKDTSCSLSSPYIFVARFLLTSLPYRALPSTPERTQAVPSLLLTYSLLVFYWRLYLIVPCRRLQNGHKLFPLFSLHILYSFSPDVFTLSCPVVDSRKDTSCSLSSPYIFFTRFLLTSLPYRALSSTPERIQAFPSLLLTYFLLVFYWRLYLIVPCRRLQKGHKLFPLFSLHILYSFSTDVFTLSCPVVDSRKDTSCSLSSPYIFVARFLLTSLPYRALSSTPERTQAVPSLLLTYSLLVFYWRLYLIVPCRRLKKGHKLFPLLSLHILYSFSTDVYTLSCPVVDSRKDTSCSLSCPYIFITRFLLTSLPYRALSSTPERTQAVPSLLFTYSLFIFYWRLYLIVPCRRFPKGHKLFPLFSLHILYSFSTDVFNLSCPVVDSQKDTSCSLSSPFIFFSRFLLTSLPYRALSSTPERTQAVPSLLFTYSLFIFYWRLYLIVPCRRFPKGHKLFPLFSLHILYSFSTDVFTLSCPVVDSRKDTSCSLSSPYIFFTRFLLTSLPYRALSSTTERTQAFPLFSLHICCSFSTDVFTLSCPVVDSRKDISCSLSSSFIFFTRFLLTSLPYRALSSTPERTQAVPSLLLTYSLFIFYWRLYLIVPCRRFPKGHKLFPLFSLHILYSFSTDVFTLSCPVVDSRKDTSCSLSSPYIFFTRFLLTSLPYRALSSTPERTQAVPSLLLTYSLLVFYWRLYLIVPCRQPPKGHKLLPHYSLHIRYSFFTDVFTLSCPVVDSRKDTSCSLSSPYIFVARFLLTSLPYRALSSTPERTQAVPSLLLTYSLLVFYWHLPYRALSSTPERTQAVPSLLLTYFLLVFYWCLYLIVPCRRLQKGHKLFPLFSLHILYSFSTDVFTLSCPVVDSRKDTSCSLSSPYIFVARFLLTFTLSCPVVDSRKDTSCSLSSPYIFFTRFLLTSLPYRALSSTPERTQAVPSLLLTYSLLVFYWHLPYRALSSTPERTQAVPSLLLTYSLLVFGWRLYLIVPFHRLQKGHKLFPLSSLHILYSFSTDVFTLWWPVVDSRKDTSCSLSSPYIFFTRFLLTSLPYRALSLTPERTQAVPSLLLTYSLLVFFWRLYLIVPCRRLQKGHKLFPFFSLHIRCSFSTDVFTLSCPVVDSRKDRSCSLSSPYIFFIPFLLTSLLYRALSSTPERTRAVPSLLLTYLLLVFYWRLYLIVRCRRLQKGHKLFPLFSLHILY